MNVAAVFFPVDAEASAYDLVQETRSAMLAGLRLYTNGRQFALLPKPVNGWALFTERSTPANAPCRA
jgi:hypothetical protein